MDNLEHLNEKKRLLENNIKNQYITNDFTDGVDNFQIYIIKTEGIDANYNLMDIYTFIEFLDELKYKNDTNVK